MLTCPSEDRDEDYYYVFSLSSGGYVRGGLLSDLEPPPPEPVVPTVEWYELPVLRTIVRMQDEGTLLPWVTVSFGIFTAVFLWITFR